MKKLIGPFSQLLTMQNISLRGAVLDENLPIINNAAIVVENGKIFDVGNFDELRKKYSDIEINHINQDSVALPGFVDAHTHICFDGNRALDYAMRSNGKTYLEIAQNGGGIASSVTKTRAASQEKLSELTAKRANQHLSEGVTTIEVKSGYGLSVVEELKMLRAIKTAQNLTKANLVPTCLAAHIKPKDFTGNASEYLNEIAENLLPKIKAENLANRVDIFIEQSAFNYDDAKEYLQKAKNLGFGITVHADQFSVAGSKLAVELNALSADHLEASSIEEIKLIAKSNVVAVALPLASYGLGIYEMTKARELLNHGAILAIASDWNPGSAPMGDLLCGAALFGIYEKLSAAEIFSALTFRAAKALNLNDRGRIEKNMIADLQLYPCNDYREILYHQGKMKPFMVFKNGAPQ
ncbi:MAG: imidazolonepropionase [Rickettsiales bacterium]|nr:imidazolonepropionase [Rickettsiales bacterium]